MKKTVFAIGLFVLVLLTNNSSVSAQLTAPYHECLTTWEFSRDSTQWETVNIPHSTNAIDGHSKQYYRGKTFYRRTVTLSGRDIHRPVFLLFEGAAQQADIYVNGSFLTHHNGGYTAFTVDISKAAKKGSNDIVVVCDNHEDVNLIPVSSDFNKNNGLHNPAHLLRMNKVFCDPSYSAIYRMRTFTPAVSHEEAQFVASVQLHNSARLCRKVALTLRLLDREGNEVTMEKKTIKLRKRSAEICELGTSLEKPHLWDGLDDPYLYTAELTVSTGRKVLDKTSTQVGFRYYELTADRGFFLNGRSYPLRGVSMHQDTDGQASAVTRSDLDRDYAIVQELGANVLRLAHYPHNDYAFHLCDSLGILVQTEIPWVNVCGKNAQPVYFENIRSMAAEMAANLCNHPSIILWGMWNELDTWGNNNKLQGSIDFEKISTETAKVYDTIKAIDPYRPVGMTDDSNYHHPGYATLKGDFYSENRYHGWYYSKGKSEYLLNFTRDMTKIHDLVPTHVVNVAEYGAGCNPFCHSVDSTLLFSRKDDSRHYEEYANYLHEHHWQQICAMPWINFTTAWILFDFPVANREEGYQDSDDGITFTPNEARKYTNDKGFVTRDRQVKKDVFYLYKSAWNHHETTVHIAGTRLHYWPSNQPVIVKTYSNAHSLTLYVDGTPTETLTSSGEISGVIWKFAPVKMTQNEMTFKVVADDGTEDTWTLKKLGTQ